MFRSSSDVVRVCIIVVVVVVVVEYYCFLIIIIVGTVECRLLLYLAGI